MRHILLTTIVAVVALASGIIAAHRTSAAYQQQIASKNKQIGALEGKLKSRDVEIKGLSAMLQVMSPPGQATEEVTVTIPEGIIRANGKSFEAFFTNPQ